MDNRGSTLIENVIAIFLLAIFAVMASTSVLSGMSALTNAALENQRLYRIYSLLEEKDYTPGTGLSADPDIRLTFDFEGRTPSINPNDVDYSTDGIKGTMYYDSEKKILGDFVHD